MKEQSSDFREYFVRILDLSRLSTIAGGRLPTAAAITTLVPIRSGSGTLLCYVYDLKKFKSSSARIYRH